MVKRKRFLIVGMLASLCMILQMGCAGTNTAQVAVDDTIKEAETKKTEEAEEVTEAEETEEVQDAEETKEAEEKGDGSENTESDTVSNGIFSITLPGDAKGTFVAETDERSVYVYDKEAREGDFGGFAFGVSVYKEPSEYAGGMDTKVGEYTSSDGTLYDVVMEFPSDVQYDYVKYQDGMPKTYARLYEGAKDIVKTSFKPEDGGTFVWEGGVKGEDLYKEVLEKYVKAINEEWDAEKLESEEMTTMLVSVASAGNNALDTIGFAYKDVNVDGIEELLIGEIAEGDWKGTVYDVYTMADRKPVHVLSGWDRNRYYALEYSLMVNEYSGGAGESGYVIFDIEPNTGKIWYQLSLKYSEYDDPDNPWFISYDFTDDGEWTNWENVTEEEFNDRLSSFTDYVRFDFTPLSSL
ncbi:MAG: hypothetical protein K6B28_00125 [Lachnospiraceae bacterium]|nr:hypothetical protein [Lachnospiraceae bacterium]